ncbi:hypothetical protein FGG08_005865 [Glutinoglossum americanum]|uniref:Nucleolar 27S pre-rRNA processing Urb2/Npa2 C-terminal domain-containing protein n=1 Tax=Glutinoglossum americanum TaxID=1670608 RepID=A0A9P8I8J7_9PEZI|nr:hypothetical protein FGG08_005865 [Glutinoglossum americanum]
MIRINLIEGLGVSQKRYAQLIKFSDWMAQHHGIRSKNLDVQRLLSAQGKKLFYAGFWVRLKAPKIRIPGKLSQISFYDTSPLTPFLFSSARLDPRSWHLVGYLIQRLPVATTAILLSAHKFLQALDSTLLDAIDEEQPGYGTGKTAVQEGAVGQYPNTSDNRRNSSEVSGSSATITGCPISVPVPSSRKRKRQFPSTKIHGLPVGRQRCDSHIGSLLSSILLALESIFASSTVYALDAECKEFETTDYDQVHMKAALRGNPDVASRILGNWFRIVNMVTSSSEGNFDGYYIHTSNSCFNPLVQIWQNRSLEWGDGPDHVSKVFSAHCLVPALRLLSKFMNTPNKSKMVTDGISSIESLLVRHILLPTRVSFSSPSVTSAIAHKEAGIPTNSLLANFLEPLRLEISDIYKTPGYTGSGEGSWSIISGAITLLFEIAIRSSTYSGIKRRTRDILWVEEVFTTLAGSIGLAISPSTTTEIQPGKIDLLERMLDTAIRSDISLSSEVLKSMATNYSNLFSGANKEIRWKLLEKISKLDEDIIYASGRTDTKLLDPLLAQIANLAIPKSTKGDADNNSSIARTILLRLLQTFTRTHITGFISHWQKGLEKVERVRVSSGSDDALDATRFSLWEDEDLVTNIGCLLVKSLTLEQIKEILGFSQLNIGRSLGRISDPEQNIKTFISLVTLDAIIHGFNQDGVAILDLVEENTRSVYGALLQLASSTSRLKPHRWRIWRVLSRIQEFWKAAIATTPPGLSLNASPPPDTSKLTGHGVHSLLQSALESAHSSLKRGLPGTERQGRNPQRYLEALLAFDFILHMARVQCSIPAARTEQSARAVTSDVLDHSVDLLVQCLSQLVASTGFEIAVWDGKPQSVAGEQVLGVALTARLAVYCPEALLQITSAARVRLFRLLYELASLTHQNWKHTPQTCQLSFARIWDGLLSNENLLLHAKLKDEIIGALSEFLDAKKSGTPALSAECSDIKALAVLNLSKLPLEVFRRGQRERILDILLSTLFHTQAEHKVSNDSLNDQISLILKFMDVPNASATLDQERSHRYLKSFSESLLDNLSNIPSLKSNLGPLQLIKSSLVVLWPHLEALPGDVADALRDARGKYVRLLLSDLRDLQYRLEKGDPLAHPPVKALMDAAIELPSLGYTLTDSEMHTVLQAVGETGSLLFPCLLQLRVDGGEEGTTNDPKLSTSDSLAATCFDHSQDIIIYTAWFSVYLLKLDKTERPSLSHTDWKFLRNTFHRFAKSFKQSGRLSLLLYLKKVAFQDFAFNGECCVLLLRALIVLDECADAQPAYASKALSSLYSKLCLNLCQANDFYHFCLIIDAMELITRKKPWVITQWNIDVALSVIASAASSTGPQISTNHSGAVYIRLCETTRGILAGHRLNLRGRFHLIVPLMQNLLRCLFLPNRSVGTQVEALGSMPQWLSPNVVAAAPYAIAYARLLRMLCNPAASSVAGSNNRHKELTPATAKAHRIAGQHLPYILMEYIQCQLQYRLSPEVKSALIPGLYAILEVSNPQTLRMVNAAMDASGRALFKVLYTDYNRFGKWDGH